MSETEQHVQVSQSDIKIALLENNNVIFERMDKAIKESSVDMTKAVNDKTDRFIEQLNGQAKEIGVLTAQQMAFETRISGIWAKIISLTAIVGVVMGVIGYFIGGTN